MLNYEITAVVAEELTARFEAFMLKHHIPELLATGYFQRASISRNGQKYRVVYEANSHNDLERYLANDAERVRKDFVDHLPAGIEITRTTWDVLGVYPRP